ncbi:sigma-70 family RNA polymerase sigma factor [Amycolatopsis acidiphila]|nr:sigma-70 family RNA polymerase sigma factor [Amycolatopsis acidiphila]UIJ63186.1 sigma-70 family RNA polymerase sigma factor [Amycolatopsis acidiphila]
MSGEDREPPSVDESLVTAALAGLPGATGELLRRLAPLVMRHCKRKVLPGERWRIDAEDLAQEVVLAALAALPRYHYPAGAFLAYTFAIANRKLAETRRRHRNRGVTPVGEFSDESRPLAVTWADPWAEVERADVRRRLTALLATLPPRTRQILRLRVVDGLSARETAEVLGMSSGSVRVVQHRALSDLRRRVQADHWFQVT